VSRKKDVDFLHTSDHKLVEQKEVLKEGDWLLTWNAKRSDETNTGFELYTPPEYNASSTSIPLGGTVLAAMYFMLEYSDENFAGEMIARANQLAEKINGGEVIKPTLN